MHASIASLISALEPEPQSAITFISINLAAGATPIHSSSLSQEFPSPSSPPVPRTVEATCVPCPSKSSGSSLLSSSVVN